jgi:hypothetical protein
MHNTENEALKRLQTEARFKSLCEAQARESDFQASEAIYDLFDSYLEDLQTTIAKADHELGMMAWIEERPMDIIVLDSANIKHVVQIMFQWMPLISNMPFQTAKFSPKQRQIVDHTLALFAKSIGFEVNLVNSLC